MGFYCKESGKILRDSLSYLDHINGKKRARAPFSPFPPESASRPRPRRARATATSPPSAPAERNPPLRSFPQSNAPWASRCASSARRCRKSRRS